MAYLVQWRTKSQDELIKRVNSHLDSIKMNFFEIGAYLYEAQARMYYRGYDSIIDFAKDNFGFEKTLTYDLIKVFKMFRNGDTYLPDPSIIHLNQSQLIALCSCHSGRETLAAIIKPTDSVKDVKKAIKLFNALSVKKRSTFKSDNLQDFFEEFECESFGPNFDLNVKINNLLDESGCSVQTEKSKSELKPVPIRDYVLDVMGEISTNEFAQNLSDAIFNLKHCSELFTVGCEYLYKLRKTIDACQVLFNLFYYGTEDRNI